MQHPTEFENQAALESFLLHLQDLYRDSIIFIQNTTTADFIYQFTAPCFSSSLMAQLQATLPDLAPNRGQLSLSGHSPDRFFYSSHPVSLISEHFSGRLWIIQPVPAHSYPPTVSSPSFERLADLFHSHSHKMQHMFSIIERVAITEYPVLVRGESGSGKELVAKAVHERSQRRDQVFIAINCAALNMNILESELFGHVKGAFTGAIREHKGVFERAAGGTLFLDEIAEIPLELQAKLLRVLEIGEFIPLGGEKSIKSDVRIIAATHRALREEARLGRFRQDLLYRLRVIPIFVPPLRERKEDIPDIAHSILTEQQSQFQVRPSLSAQALKALLQYDWPGNVRELKNTLLYALTMASGKKQIELTDLPDEIVFTPPIAAPLPDLPPGPQPCTKIDPVTLKQLLHQYHNNITLTAQALGISRTTLWRYRKRYGL